MNAITGQKRLLHGGDYNPEQWLKHPEILEKDIEYFKKAHINTVSMGIFSWGVLEPEEGKYEFQWLEDRINQLYENGISTILATPSAARPKWMADKYPEVLQVDETRHRKLFGGRHNFCHSSPVYREKTRAIDLMLSKKFGKHPGVIMWHISNEFGGECHCPLCQDKFRQWLENKYKTIDALNDAWCTTFWSHQYQSFSQIESPSPRGERQLHGLNLDWKRFVTEQTRDFLLFEKQAIRDGGSDKPVTANFMYDYQGLDYHRLCDGLDLVSWDNYPTWHKREEYETAIDSGMQHDIMRTLLKKPFLLMESCPSATNWQGVSKLKKPGMLEAASLQAVAHGSDSVLYFQLRQSQGASEKFHGAVIDHYGGPDTRVLREVTRVGERLSNLSFLTGTETEAKAAVLFDWHSRWAMENAQGPRNDGLYYKETVSKSYRALRRLGLNVDLPDMTQSLDQYSLVVVPMAYLFRGQFEERLKNYVEGGGCLVMTYWSGIVDENDRCFLGGTPHGLMEAAGLRSTEIDGLYDWEENHGRPLEKNSLGMTRTYSCRNLCELVKTDGAEIIMEYTDDFYAGYPVLTSHLYKKGQVYYICADMEQAFYDDLYEKLAALMDLKGPAEVIPEGVEVTVRTDGEKDYAILQNFSRQPAKVKLDQGWTLIENGTLILETENNHRDQQEEAWLNPLETQVFCKIKKEQA